MKADIPTNPEQRWEWIKYQLRVRGTSFADLARQLDVQRNAVTGVKRLPYPRMERAIARKLGMSPMTIWPERWNQDGTPARQRPNRAENNIAAKPHSHICAQNSGSNAIAHRQRAVEA